MKPHSTPVNKSDGFMPVRGASMATDHDTFSDSSNLIHSSTVSSSSRPILSSLPQEPAKPSRYYVNQCAVVVELLLRLFNCGCSVSIHPLRVLNATDIFLRIVWSAGWVASQLVQSRQLPPSPFRLVALRTLGSSEFSFLTSWNHYVWEANEIAYNYLFSHKDLFHWELRCLMLNRRFHKATKTTLTRQFWTFIKDV